MEDKAVRNKLEKDKLEKALDNEQGTALSTKTNLNAKLNAKRTKVYFASDAHLGSDVYGDSLERERRLVRWMESIKQDAKALYLVGDMFDYWFEYHDVVPKGYVRFIGKMAELADAGVAIYLFAGNHDVWLFDYFQKEVGATVIDGSYETEYDGKRFYIAHGDGLGDPSRTFRFLRAFFRNKFCQQLYKMIPPRLTIPFAHAWSRHNRKKKQGTEGEEYLGEEKEYLVQFAKKYNKQQNEKQLNTDFFVFGHRHIELDLMIAHNSRVVILGDWLTHFSYGVWDGEEFALMEEE